MHGAQCLHTLFSISSGEFHFIVIAFERQAATIHPYGNSLYGTHTWLSPIVQNKHIIPNESFTFLVCIESFFFWQSFTCLWFAWRWLFIYANYFNLQHIHRFVSVIVATILTCLNKLRLQNSIKKQQQQQQQINTAAIKKDFMFE